MVKENSGTGDHDEWKSFNYKKKVIRDVEKDSRCSGYQTHRLSLHVQSYWQHHQIQQQSRKHEAAERM
jgi:hypothetical protein